MEDESLSLFRKLKFFKIQMLDIYIVGLLNCIHLPLGLTYYLQSLQNSSHLLLKYIFQWIYWTKSWYHDAVMYQTQTNLGKIKGCFFFFFLFEWIVKAPLVRCYISLVNVQMAPLPCQKLCETTGFSVTASHTGTEHCVVLPWRMSCSIYFYEEKLFKGKSEVLREMELGPTWVIHV